MIGKDIYDLTIDEVRKATQADVYRFQGWLETCGKTVKALRKLYPDLVPPPGPNFDERLRERLDAFLKNGDA